MTPKCDICGEETELRQPIDLDGDHLLVCAECAAEREGEQP